MENKPRLPQTFGWIAAALAALVIVELLFFSASALGRTLLSFAVIAIYFCTFGKRGLDRWQVTLIVLIAALALPYTLFNNTILRFFNFVVFAFLTGTLFLRPVLTPYLNWDSLTFYLEVFLGALTRPFSRLFAPWRDLAEKKHAREGQDGSAATTSHSSDRIKRAAVQIIVAVLISIPLLFILFNLLASSDSVFKGYARDFFDIFGHLGWGTFVSHSILIVMLFPFMLSIIWSYRENTTSLKGSKDATQLHKKAFRVLPPISVATVLSLVNLLYLFYAIVQFSYISAAFSGKLPHGIAAYSQYVQNGFAELAVVTAINIILILGTISLTKREGRANAVLRILSVALIALTVVQLTSAFFRMKLYVDGYGLTEMRVFVTLFMTLIAICLLVLLAKEFAPEKVPVFKMFLLAGCAILLATNFISPDALTARYNIEHYLADDLQVDELDIDYLWYGLSVDSNSVVMAHEKQLCDKDSDFKEKFDEYHRELSVNQANNSHAVTSDDPPFLQGRPFGYLSYSESYRVQYEEWSESWKSFNFGTRRLAEYIDK